jgi:hypothetical protein
MPGLNGPGFLRMHISNVLEELLSMIATKCQPRNNEYADFNVPTLAYTHAPTCHLE